MLTGGIGAYNDVELIDLSGQSLTCPEIPDTPHDLDESSVGTFIGDRALVCGGWAGGLGTNACYSYDSQVRRIFE